ncbi:MAG: Ig-like domain-containing protein [Pirellulaceae bacterium]
MSPSPVLAPNRDVFGLLRVDDFTVATPPGIGGNVFKDRGAVDRADFVGPGATLILPFDNDAAGNDADPNLTRVDWQASAPGSFRIRLQDIADPADPFVGSNINNDTVINSTLDGLRESGAAITLFENGRLLEEGVDYAFRFDTTTETIILNPLAGAWRPEAVYQIGLNNRDRFVLLAPSGTQAVDGQQFVVTDDSGGTVTFEYETGYQLQLPTDINLLIPQAGGGAGGVRDGDRIRITSPNGLTVTTFELDRDNTTLAGNIRVPFALTDTQADIVRTLNEVLLAQVAFPLTAVADQGGGRIELTPKTGVDVDVRFESAAPSLLINSTPTQSTIQVDTLRRVSDGDLITVVSGGQTFNFEIDLAGTAPVQVGNRRVQIRNALNPQLVAEDIRTAMNALGAINAQFPYNVVGVPVNGLLTLTPKVGRTPTIESNPVPRIATVDDDSGFGLQVPTDVRIFDGDLLRVSSGGEEFVFEIENANNGVADGNLPIFVQSSNRQQVVTAITSALRARLFSIAEVQTSANNPTLDPGVLFLAAEPGTVVETGFSAISQPAGSLALQVSPIVFGIGGVSDGQTFTINDGGQSITFEFERDLQGITTGNVEVNVVGLETSQELVNALATAIQGSGLAVAPEIVNDRLLFLGLGEGASVTSQSGGLSVVGYARPLQDGDGFTLSVVDANGSDKSVSFQYLPTSNIVTPDVITFDLDNDGNVDLTIPRDMNGDGVDDEYVSVDSDLDGVVERLLVNVDGVNQVDALGNDVPDVVFNMDVNLDGILDGRFNMPSLMTTPFEADFDDDLTLDLRFPVDADQDGFNDVRTFIDADDDGNAESLQIQSAPGGITSASITIAFDANDDGIVDRPLFYPARSNTAYEADFDFDGIIDVRFPRDINGDGVEDIRTLVYPDNNGGPGTEPPLNQVPISINVESDGIRTFPVDPITNLPDLTQDPIPDATIVVDAMGDGTPDSSVVLIPIELTQSNEIVAQNTVAAISDFIADPANSDFAAVLPSDPRSIDGGLISIGGLFGLDLQIISGSPLDATGQPGVTANTTLSIAGPLVLSVPAVGGVAIPDGSTFSITNNNQTVTFEFDANVPPSLNNVLNVPIPYALGESADVIALRIQQIIDNAGLGLATRVGGGGTIQLDGLDDDQVDIPLGTTLTKSRGTVSDGETITISDGVRSVTFEFERSVGGGGVTGNNQSVIFNANGTSEVVAETLAAAISNSILGIATSVNGTNITLDGATSNTVVTSNTNSVEISGVPGGAIPVSVIRSGTFSDLQVRDAIIDAVNNSAAGTSLTASVRGDNTIFLEGAETVDTSIPNYFLRAIADNVGNPLKSNQIDNSTTFSILLSGAQFDYGDAPDPVDDVPGRYPTTRANDGARHLYIADGIRFGQWLDADADGQPQIGADGDDQSLVVLTDDDANPGSPSLFTVTAENSNGPTVVVNTDQTEISASYEGRLLVIDNGLQRVTFELDSDGIFDEDNVRIAFDPDGEFGPATTPAALAANLSDAIRRSGLQLAGRMLNGNKLVLIADDEDGLTLGTAESPTNVLRPGAATLFTITVQGTGLVDGWIDFNRDGDWNDPGERIFDGQRVTGTETFEITLPATASVLATPEGITTMARFRLSTAGVSSPTGLAFDGEVEDYEVRVVAGAVTASPDAGGLYNMVEDGTLNLNANQGVLANDVRRVGTTLSVYGPDTGIRQLANGTLDLKADGSFAYTPNPDFFGVETFSYRAFDQTLFDVTGALLVTEPTVVTIDVRSDNDAPRGGSQQQAIATNEDFARIIPIASLLGNLTQATTDDFVPGPANESDQTLSIELTAGGTTDEGGTVRLQDGNLIYTPANNFSGTDRFVYRVVDDGVPVRGVNVTMTVNVGQANDPPVLATTPFLSMKMQPSPRPQR